MLTQKQLQHNLKIQMQNAARRANAKAYYYKQEITTLKQLEKNCKRLITNLSMCTSTKQQHIEKMFASLQKNTCN